MKEPKPALIVNLDEPSRAEVNAQPIDYAEFLARTRRVHKLTKSPPTDLRYAKGLDSKPSDFA